MEPMIYGTSAPHRRSKITTQKIMQYIILALVPAGINGVLRYGISAAFVILLTCVSAVAAGFLFEKFINISLAISYASKLYIFIDSG